MPQLDPRTRILTDHPTDEVTFGMVEKECEPIMLKLYRDITQTEVESVSGMVGSHPDSVFDVKWLAHAKRKLAAIDKSIQLATFLEGDEDDELDAWLSDDPHGDLQEKSIEAEFNALVTDAAVESFLYS